jgi:hypothetical protein
MSPVAFSYPTGKFLMCQDVTTRNWNCFKVTENGSYCLIWEAGPHSSFYSIGDQYTLFLDSTNESRILCFNTETRALISIYDISGLEEGKIILHYLLSMIR